MKLEELECIIHKKMFLIVLLLTSSVKNITSNNIISNYFRYNFFCPQAAK